MRQGPGLAFLVAAIRKAEPEVRRFVEDRTLIIDTQEAARQMEHVKNMVLLLRADAIAVAGLLAQLNLVIIPVGRDNPTPGNANPVGVTNPRRSKPAASRPEGCPRKKLEDCH